MPFDERDLDTAQGAEMEYWALDGEGVPLTLAGQEIARGMIQAELQPALRSAGYQVDCWSAASNAPAQTSPDQGREATPKLTEAGLSEGPTPHGAEGNWPDCGRSDLLKPLHNCIKRYRLASCRSKHPQLLPDQLRRPEPVGGLAVRGRNLLRAT